MHDETHLLRFMADRIETLVQQVSALDGRIRDLEAELKSARMAAPAATGAAQEDVSEEVALVIAAAVAAYLGKRPRIRQIRLLGSAAWAQQGRVSIQASHGLMLQH